MTIGLSKRTHISFISVMALFLFIFSGLFCGFLIAHFFPDQVVRFVYGTGTETHVSQGPKRENQDQNVLPGSGIEDSVLRERDLSASLQLQSVLESIVLGQNELSPTEVFNITHHFVKHRKPPLPGANITATAGAPASERATASYLPAAQYPAAEWRRIEAQAGVVESVTVVSTGAKLGDGMPKVTDMLEVSGWIGDPVLGLRFKDVVFAMCGMIVGHTKISLLRPDVARAVHPNLFLSGWRAKLYVAYLPRCTSATLHVLGVVPGSMTVMSAGAPIPLKLPATDKMLANAPSGAPLFTPKNVTAARFIPVNVLPDSAELRRCGAVDCAAVGQVAKGRYAGHIAEEANGWVLLIMKDKSGWLARSQISWER